LADHYPPTHDSRRQGDTNHTVTEAPREKKLLFRVEFFFAKLAPK